MAFDQLARLPLPRRLKPGDHLLWLEAGAYHLPWETRFSHGLAAIFWHDGRRVTQVRQRESFDTWWNRSHNGPAPALPYRTPSGTMKTKQF
jgi:hypothetical protein